VVGLYDYIVYINDSYFLLCSLLGCKTYRKLFFSKQRWKSPR